MEAFEFVQATTPQQAIAEGTKTPTAQLNATVRFVAGGTNLTDLMKLNVERPREVIDINRLQFSQIEELPGGGLRLGALSRNADVAWHPVVKRDYTVLSEALLSGASPQIRNMASTGGNLLQRTRCLYFRDTAHRCNKREPGSGCDAMEGHNRMLAILGTSDHCIATNPSDQNVALTALEATVHVQGLKGERAVPIAEFYLLPGRTPNLETVLQPGDVITAVTIPQLAAGTKSHYLKLRDRAAYEFALASAAVVVQSNNGRLEKVRIALGGVGTVPWRSREAEHVLEGKQASPELFRRAAEAAMKDAKPHKENGFKVELAQRCLTHALTTVTA
jgi:xanthine dehydrogenase YagS FAD-binding subunit